MMKSQRKNHGVRITFDTGEGRGFVEFDAVGKVVASECFVKPLPLPPQRMTDDFDPQTEARRMKQGGCCGQASE